MTGPAEPQTVGVIAGGGDLPRLVAEARARSGGGYFVIGLEGAVGGWVDGHPHVRLALGKVGAALKALRAAGCDSVVMAGGLARPSLSSLKLDMKGVSLLPRVAGLMTRGDDALLTGLAAILEEEGFAVIGAHELLGDLLAAPGVLTRRRPGPADLADIGRARAVAAALGAVDVGQAVVVAGGLCLAVETIEGTDAMLERVAALPPRRRAAAPAPSGVLCKAPKPGQDWRIDLPAVGPRTMALARAAGLNGVAVEAGGVFVLDPAATIRAADRAGLFLLGVEGEDARGAAGGAGGGR